MKPLEDLASLEAYVLNNLRDYLRELNFTDTKILEILEAPYTEIPKITEDLSQLLTPEQKRGFKSVMIHLGYHKKHPVLMEELKKKVQNFQDQIKTLTELLMLEAEK